MDGVPGWVLQLVADLIIEEDEHPKLYYQSYHGHGYQRYNWCPGAPLGRVPREVMKVARRIADYRRTSIVREETS